MRRLEKDKLSAWEKAFHQNARTLIGATIMVFVLLVGLLLFLNSRQTTDDSVGQQTAIVLFADYSQSKLVVHDRTGREVSKTDFPYPSSYVRHHATSPNGSALLSVGSGTSNEAFFFANRTNKVDFSSEAAAALASAVMLNGRHNILLISEETAVYVTCPEGQTCRLIRLNIKTGQSDTVTDSGVVSAPFAPVYLLGAGSDKKSVYLRVVGANKFGSETSAVYKIDLVSGKAASKTKVALEAGQNLAMSPDKTKLIYKTGGFGQPAELRVIDMSSGKEAKVVWDKAEIANTTDAFQWSPDSQKVLFLASESIVRPTAAADNPQRLVYFSLKDNQVRQIISLSQTYSKTITYYNWLDNENIIYKQLIADKENDFTNAKQEVYKLSIGSNSSAKVDTPLQLEKVVFY